MVDPANTGTEKAKNQSSATLKIVIGLVAAFAVLCGLFVLAVVYVFGQPYFGPKAEIILAPAYPRVYTVNTSDLEAAAEILTVRCHSLGYSGISFTAAENNQIIGRVPTSIDIEALLKPLLAVGLLEFVDFGEIEVDTGTVVYTDFDYPYFPRAHSGNWHTILTNDAFESAEVTTDQVGQPAVSFTLTADGTKVFADFTTNNVRRYLGVVLDKVVVSAPLINSAITDGNAWIQGSLTKEEAQALAAYLSAKRPLPFPLIVKDIVTMDN